MQVILVVEVVLVFVVVFFVFFEAVEGKRIEKSVGVVEGRGKKVETPNFVSEMRFSEERPSPGEGERVGEDGVARGDGDRVDEGAARAGERAVGDGAAIPSLSTLHHLRRELRPLAPLDLVLLQFHAERRRVVERDEQAGGRFLHFALPFLLSPLFSPWARH